MYRIGKYTSLVDSPTSEFVGFIDNTFIDTHVIPELNEESKYSCEGALTEEECWNALKNMANGKVPGTDGLPVEFYRLFWPEIKHLVIMSLNSGYLVGKLSTEQSRGIITLLPKEGFLVKKVQNWRPISLLNVDYKIAAACIASRLKGVLHNIIHPDQSGFLKNRYIGENIRLI